MRETLAILGLALLTSAVAGLLGMRRRRLVAARLPAALGFMLECIGLTAVFFVANIGVGMAAGITSRALGLGFIPLYLFGDATLLVLSFLQGVVFRSWLATR